MLDSTNARHVLRHPLVEGYIGNQLHVIKARDKSKKEICPVEGPVPWYKIQYQKRTEAPVVGSDLKALSTLHNLCCTVFCSLASLSRGLGL